MNSGTQVESVFTNIFGTFTMKDAFEVSRIGLSEFIKLPDGRSTKIIKPGDEVVIVNNELVDAPIKCEATHVIIGCFATLLNRDFQIVCTDKVTLKPITIKL
jgi:hypothetical protein